MASSRVRNFAVQFGQSKCWQLSLWNFFVRVLPAYAYVAFGRSPACASSLITTVSRRDIPTITATRSSAATTTLRVRITLSLTPSADEWGAGAAVAKRRVWLQPARSDGVGGLKPRPR